MVTGAAADASSELRFDESIMPLVTRHCVTFCCGLMTSRKHPVSSGIDAPQHVVSVPSPSPSLLRVVCVLGP